MPKPKNHFKSALTHFRNQILAKGKLKNPENYTHSFTDRELLSQLGIPSQFRQHLIKFIENKRIHIQRDPGGFSIATFSFKRGELKVLLDELLKTAEGKDILTFTKIRFYLEDLLKKQGIMAFSIPQSRLNSILTTKVARKRGIDLIKQKIDGKLLSWIDEENFNKLVKLYLEKHLKKHQ